MGFLFLGCSEDIEESITEVQQTDEPTLAMRMNSDDKPDVHSLIKLGGQLANPYSTASMQAAFNYYNSNVPNSPFKGRKVKATHYYIKIAPTTETHLIALDNLDKSDAPTAPILHDYPLDYEILEEGDYYVEPTNETDLYYPVYSVIPVGYQMPNGLPYTILANLYEPTDAEVDVETVALVFADWQDDIKADIGEELHVADLPKYLNESLNQLNIRLFARKFTPEGIIDIENTDSHAMDPLMKAKISVGRSFWWHETYTDYLGYFRATKSYRGEVRIRSKWRSSTATIRKAWNEILGFQVSDHLMTLTRGSNGRTKTISYTQPFAVGNFDFDGGHLWTKGTVHNGLVNYNVYCAFNGIDKPLTDSNVWAFSNGKSSATPMFYYYDNLADIALFANVGQANVWQNLTTLAALSTVALLPHRLRPDQIFQGLKDKILVQGGQSNTVRIHQLVFHESGHYSHAKKAGASFWSKVVGAEVANSIATSGASNGSDSYRDGSYPSFQAGARIGLAEGWATFTEFKITSFIYAKAFYGGSGVIARGFYISNSTTVLDLETIMENFDVYDRPMSVDRSDDQSWFLHGIMWDLLDNRNEIQNTGGTFIFSQHLFGDGQFHNFIEDDIYLGLNNSVNLSPIFNRLGSNVNDACELRQQLIQNYSNPTTRTRINNLFISYGYGCNILP